MNKRIARLTLTIAIVFTTILSVLIPMGAARTIKASAGFNQGGIYSSQTSSTIAQ